MRGGGFLYSRHRGWGFIGPLPTDLQKPPPQNNRAGELGPLPSQGVLLTQYTVFHNILCHYALRVNDGTEGTQSSLSELKGKMVKSLLTS